jgi:hypothetical protein
MPTATASEPQPPPTPTFEFPTLAPTATEGRTLPTTEAPAPLAGTGEVLYQTSFEAAGSWPIGQVSVGTISLANGSLAVVLPRSGLQRLIRSPTPPTENFVLDVMVRTEICQGTDEFGIAFWLTPEEDYMQFTITCEGGVRLRRVLGGERRAWVPFIEQEAAVLAGAPAQNRLTVRAQGDGFRLYVNGFPVLDGVEPSLPTGGTGLAVISGGDQGQTTVLFDSYTLYQLEPPVTPSPAGTEPTDG